MARSSCMCASHAFLFCMRVCLACVSFPSMCVFLTRVVFPQNWSCAQNEPFLPHLLVLNYSYYLSWDDLVHIYHGFQQNPFKTISPSGKPEGNTTHRVHCAVSPEIVLLVVAMLKCLHPGNEWGSGIKLCDLHLLL
jgi:hypothetical protein